MSRDSDQIQRLLNALERSMEMMRDDLIPYVPEEFREKWDIEDQYAQLWATLNDESMEFQRLKGPLYRRDRYEGRFISEIEFLIKANCVKQLPLFE